MLADILIATSFWFPFVLTVGVTYRYLKIIDLSIDGVAIISGITAVYIGNYFNSFTLSISLAIFASVLGSILFVVINRIFKIDSLITGILMSLSLYSLAVLFIGESLTIQHNIVSSDDLLILSMVFNILLSIFTYLFFKTKLGLIIRSISYNEKTITDYNPTLIIMIGHIFSGFVLGVASTFYVYWENIARASSGFDFLLTGFTSLLVSITMLNLLKKRIYRSLIVQVLVGTLFFQTVIYTIIFYSPYPNLWKLVLSMSLFFALARFSPIKNKKDSYNKKNELEIIKLSKSFFEDKIKILDNINVIFKKGLNILTGDNGVGKSTFLNCISGDAQITSGKIIYQGRDISSLQKFNRPILKIHQSAKQNLSSELFVYENLLITNRQVGMFSLIKKSKLYEIPNNVNKLLVNIFGKISTSKVGSLSGGEAQIMSTHIASNSSKDILILDEPTNNLDDSNKQKIVDLIRDIAKNKIVIIVSHDKDLIQHANVVYRLSDKNLKQIK